MLKTVSHSVEQCNFSCVSIAVCAFDFCMLKHVETYITHEEDLIICTQCTSSSAWAYVIGSCIPLPRGWCIPWIPGDDVQPAGEPKRAIEPSQDFPCHLHKTENSISTLRSFNIAMDNRWTLPIYINYIYIHMYIYIYIYVHDFRHITDFP